MGCDIPQIPDKPGSKDIDETEDILVLSRADYSF